MKHTCMTEREKEMRRAWIDDGPGHCLGLKLQDLTKEIRKREESCEACKEEQERGKKLAKERELFWARNS